MKHILRTADAFLNSITMYRLLLYGLGVMSLAGCVYYATFSQSGMWRGLIEIFALSLGYVGVCNLINQVCAKILHVPTNCESATITALILFLIFDPAGSYAVLTMFLASAIAIVSKYILAPYHKHIFNPAGFAAFALGVWPQTAASWWVGSSALLPLSLIIGILIVRKIRHGDLFLSFVVSSMMTSAFVAQRSQIDPLENVRLLVTSWPLIFFGTVMLTEPLTTPPSRRLRVGYGVLVGILFSSQFRAGPFFTTPEFCLILGNVYSYLVSPKFRYVLKLQDKKMIARNTYEFVFQSPMNISFKPGQYLEWTLPHVPVDARGNRRYFTIASSPTEDTIRLGVRFAPHSSSFKTELKGMRRGDTLLVGQLAGDFVMPEDEREKLLFMAGGIGVTPFRSMVQFLKDTGQKRDVCMLYSNRSCDEIAYRDVFDAAEAAGVIRIIYILTDEKNVPSVWRGLVGRIDKQMVQKVVPDVITRTAYLSGPNTMVDAYTDLLRECGVPRSRIVTDYFPGF